MRKRVVTIVAIVALLPLVAQADPTHVASSAAPAHASPAPAPKPVSLVAPADEYFGRLKLSILGIGNIIRDMKNRIEADPTKAASIFGALDNCEDAIHDWESKYPKDSWIAKDLYALIVVYADAKDTRAPLLAMRAEKWLAYDYPKSDFAAKSQLLIVNANAPRVADPPVAEAPPPVSATPAIPAVASGSQVTVQSASASVSSSTTTSNH